MQMKKKALASIALAVGFSAGAVNAASINDLLFPNELNQLSDNSAESMNLDVNDNGLLDVGDTLRGILDIGTNEDLSGGGGTVDVGGNSGNSELSAIFEVEVTGIANQRLDLAGNAIADFTFGPSAAFVAEFGLTAGTMIAFFEDGTPDFTRVVTGTTDTIAEMEALATNGALLMEMGFGLSVITGVLNDADQLWAATGAPLDPTLPETIAAGTGLGAFNIQLSMLSENLGYDFAQVAAGFALGDGMIDANGQGGILGTLGIDTPYSAFDNVDFTISPIPEPASLALLGLGLLGMGAARRRKS